MLLVELAYYPGKVFVERFKLASNSSPAGSRNVRAPRQERWIHAVIAFGPREQREGLPVVSRVPRMGIAYRSAEF